MSSRGIPAVSAFSTTSAASSILRSTSNGGLDSPRRGRMISSAFFAAYGSNFSPTDSGPESVTEKALMMGLLRAFSAAAKNGVATPGVETQLNLGHSLDLTYQPLKILGRITHRQPGDTDIQRLSSSSRNFVGEFPNGTCIMQIHSLRHTAAIKIQVVGK